ncbi:MAG: hypothetical protein KG003_13770 [Bacteroidetes bacterium]|nr:hypothetical protein [Bacteroidota bacterium]
MPTDREKIEKTTDMSEEVLTVGGLIGHLQQFDQETLILMDDRTQNIHLEFYKIIETSQPSLCQANAVIKTVYLQVEDLE